MKFKHIDSIRGIAILMVILVHTSQSVEGYNEIVKMISRYGQMGVQLFFVASAYTLCLSSKNRHNEKDFYLNYWIRRYFRIAPAYYLGIILYFIIHLLYQVNSDSIVIDSKYSFQNIAANLFFFHGFYEPANNTIVPGGWSIGTEMAFYVIFPMLFSFSKKIGINSLKAFLGWILGGLVFSQFVLLILNSVGMHIKINGFLYYNLINQLPVFMIGIAYFSFENKISNKLKPIHNFLLFAFFTCFSMFLWSFGISYFASLIPTISGISFIFLIELFKKLDSLNIKFIVRLGQVSYSTYLLHFIFAFIVSAYLSKLLSPIVGPNLTLLVIFVFTTFSTFLLALLSERYIEKPFVAMGRKIIKNRNSG